MTGSPGSPAGDPTKAPPARLTGVAANLLVMLVSTLVFAGLAFGAGELYLRLKTRGADTRFFPWFVFHETRGWALQPGKYRHFVFDESVETLVEINEFGTRNPPFSLAVPPGRRRVCVIGDSFVFSAALNEDDTAVGHLRKLLGPDFEVLNLGVESYGTGQQTLLLEELRARGFEPGEAVVFVVFSNDLLDNAGLLDIGVDDPGRPAFRVDSSGVLQATRPENNRAGMWSRRMDDRSMFLVFLRSRLTNLFATHPGLVDLAARLGYSPRLPRAPTTVKAFYGEGWEDRWRTTESVLDHTVDLIRDRVKARLVIAYLPSPFQALDALQKVAHSKVGQDSVYSDFLADLDRPQRHLEEFCERRDIPFVDATGTFRAAQRSTPPFYPREAHLNAEGSRLFAQALAPAILGHPPVAGSPSTP